MSDPARRSDPPTDYDVVVVGSGAAGLSAAATASDAGARVLVVEAAPRTGGSTALSGGVFYAAGTSVQRERDIDDPGAEDMLRYWLTLNQWKLRPALAARICRGATPAFEWLRDIGVRFPAQGLYAAGADPMPRGHRAEGGGAEIASVLEASLQGRSVDIAVDTRMERLLVEDGSVRGIRAGGTDVRADGVVVASGGFGASPDKLQHFYPDAARHGDAHWYIGSDHCRGDGIDAAVAVGAGIDGRNRGLLLLTPGFGRDLESYLPGWLMLVGADGRRFVNEALEYSVLSAILKEQPGASAFAVFDEDARRSSRLADHRPAPSWTADRLLDAVDAGTLQQAGSLAELAGKIGVPAAALIAEADRMTEAAAGGADADFFKPPALLRPVRTPPFYAARIRAAIICWTGCGIAIDPDARALDEAGRRIPGLFAAGETTGGMFGECYASGGASIANAVVFGRIAGHNAATARRQA
ncbi:fumarate reductase flavoprotein subunit [Sphingomonas jejuensis]|uniref:Fumarate reductase flavoprotein subunit n=1 Tax=Sphingomonas jejuensis TaxID=904715 RepID=A0ABX0XJG8_9SPHN|nr:fumarate reductase flavoprotein subunit [Sphingomonas jejuensis]